MSSASLFDPSAYFKIVSEVNESWDKIKSIPDYAEVFGSTLFGRMYDLAPSDKIWKVYSFVPEDIKGRNETFVHFAKRFVRMLDVAVSMLGPDIQLLQEQMYDVGAVHEKYEVMPRHFDLMQEALEYTIEKILKPEDLKPKTTEAWKALFAFFSTTMMEGASDMW